MNTRRPDEKSHYTYDEIMERLREVKSGKDPNSTKPQKRRSHQPKVVREKRSRRIKLLCYGILVPLVLLLAAFIFFANSYYQGAAFKNDVAARVSESLGREVELSDTRVTNLGTLVSGKRLQLFGDQSSVFRYADATNLAVSLEKSAWFDADWDVELFNVKSLELEFASRKVPLGDDLDNFIPPSRARPEKGTPPLELYALRLMAVDATGELENEGRALVIVAMVGPALHIRIFDSSGEMIIDKPESQLLGGQELTELKALMASEPLPDVSAMSRAQTEQIIENAASSARFHLLEPAPGEELRDTPGDPSPAIDNPAVPPNPVKAAGAMMHGIRGNPRMLHAGIGLAGGPESFLLRGLAVSRMSVSWINAAREKSFIEESQLFAKFEEGGNIAELQYGKLQLPGWPALDIETIKFFADATSIHLESGTLQNSLFVGSEVRVKRGLIDFEADGGTARINFAVKNFDLTKLAPEGSTSFFDGKVNCRDIYFFGKFDEPEVSVFSGDFELLRPVVKNLPFQQFLNVYATEPKLLRLELDYLTGRFTKRPDYVELTDIEGFQEGVARFTADRIRVDESGKLSGELRLGLSRLVISRLPQGNEIEFDEEDDSFGWVTVKFGGKVKEPWDSLKEQVESQTDVPAALDTPAQ